jgi:hypothetical protein
VLARSVYCSKDGLQFYCLDGEGERVTCEDVADLDKSFQLDRRVWELFFTVWAQSIGVAVYHGVGVEFEAHMHCPGTNVSAN